MVRTIDANTVLLYVDLHFANEYTSPQAFAGLVERGVTAPVPDAHLCVVDHIIPSVDVTPRVIADAASLRQAQTLEANCRRNGIDAFYGANDPYQGIEHVVVDEQGLARPGMVVICGDSHTTTHGALGALGFGIGTSEIEHILATQTLVYRLAKTMLVCIDGELPEGSTAKDLALMVLRTISARGALGHVVEYQGSAIDALSVEGRMTLCNLTVEAGARGSLIAPDAKTAAWVEAHAPDLAGDELEAARAYWKTLAPDEGAVYDRTVTIDASGVKPMVTWGTSPDQCSAIDEQSFRLSACQSVQVCSETPSGLTSFSLTRGADSVRVSISISWLLVIGLWLLVRVSLASVWVSSENPVGFGWVSLLRGRPPFFPFSRFF